MRPVSAIAWQECNKGWKRESVDLAPKFPWESEKLARSFGKLRLVATVVPLLVLCMHTEIRASASVSVVKLCCASGLARRVISLGLI